MYCTVVIFIGMTTSDFTGVLWAWGLHRLQGDVYWALSLHWQSVIWFLVHNLFVLDINFLSRSETLEKRARLLQGITLQAVPNVLCAPRKVLTQQSFFKRMLKASVCLKALIYRNRGLDRAKKGSCCSCFPNRKLAIFVDGLFLQWPTFFYPIWLCLI